MRVHVLNLAHRQRCTSATLSPCVKATHSTVALPMPPSHTQRKYMKKKSRTGSTVFIWKKTHAHTGGTLKKLLSHADW
eukprot:m.390835 g.390835  ORF g.390835 m.390835 type:complete len:78 (+) comp28305_c0_seq41:965-1198(+)